MSTYLSESSLLNLKKLIGQTITTITSDNWKPHGQSLGNVLIETNTSYFTINNDFETVTMSGELEDLTALSVVELNVKSDYFKDTHVESLITESINKTIASITIVRDTMSFSYDDHTEDYVLDRAIIMDLGEYKWLVSAYSLFSPITYIFFDLDVIDHLPSLEELEEVFSYEPTSGIKPYTTSVTRELIHLKA